MGAVEERQQLKDMQVAMLNILEDSTADRLRAEAAVKASLNLLEDLSEAQAEIRTLSEQRTAELVAANKNLEAFTYSVAHDLRSPLRALSGYSEALMEDYGDRLDETGRWYTERIQAATERMGALIEDLLNLSQVSRADLSLGPVDLSTEVAAIAGELQAREPGRRVRFDLQDGVWVNADRTLIRTVLQNLVENAWKYTAKRDGATIEFGTTAAEDGRVCCYVRDNGAGFDPAFGGRLFQPFQRLHAVTEFPGTGIGLASVRRIIERHGGRVWAEGAVGRGATFYFTLNPTKDTMVPPIRL
jgi:signal transduction histidine kinase